MADTKITQENCHLCPMHRPGNPPYCAKTGKRIRPEEPVPLICSPKIGIKAI